MSRLDDAKKLVNSLKKGGSSRRSDKGRLSKAMASVRRVSEIRKADHVDFDLKKGVYDAMAHHAAHAAAAMRVCYEPGVDAEKCREAAKQHTFLFLRHALENCRDRDPWAMKDGLRRAVDYFEMEAPYDLTAEMDHFKSGGEVVHAKEDGDFMEDYEHGGTPNTKKTGTKRE